MAKAIRASSAPPASPPLGPDESPVSPDAALIALCEENIRVDLESTRLGMEWGDIPPASTPPRITKALRKLVDHGHELRELVAETPALTLPGVLAKARAVQAHWGADAVGDGEVAYSMIKDLLRLFEAAP